MNQTFSTTRRLLAGDRTVLTFLGLLLAADGVFLLLNFAPAPESLRDGRLLLELDQGFPEVFQYIKAFWIAALLTVIAFRERHLGYLLWAALYLYFLFDDALSIHESLGVRWLGIEERMVGLSHEGQELVFVLLVLVPVLSVLLAAFWRGGPAYRAATRPLFLLTAALAFFGVVVDKIHGMVGWSEGINIFVGTVEDWGEMVVMSLVVGYAMALFLRGDRSGKPPPPPRSRLDRGSAQAGRG